MSHYTSVAYFPLWAPIGLIKLAFLEFDCQGLQLTNLGQKSIFFTRCFEAKMMEYVFLLKAFPYAYLQTLTYRLELHHVV